MIIPFMNVCRPVTGSVEKESEMDISVEDGRTSGVWGRSPIDTDFPQHLYVVAWQAWLTIV